MENAPPTIYLVSTPIGNLGDITLRALETLKSVDVIACEDTRKTRILLQRYEIEKRLIAFHEHNEFNAVAGIIQMVEQGKSVAIVSDAGTPAVSDPGYLLIRTAIEKDIPMTVIPGPTALVGAVALSGLPMHSFLFKGFPPRKSGRLRRFFEEEAESPHTMVLYESPYRLDKTLEVLGDRPAALVNDLTKLFEKVDRGTLSQLLAQEKARPGRAKGEFCIVIGGKRDD